MKEPKTIKILWVTHDFPPRRSSGIYRPIKIYKYIDKDKYKITFLTQSIFNENVFVDDTLIGQLTPEPQIHRLPNIVIDNFLGYVSKACKKFKKQADSDGSKLDLKTRSETPSKLGLAKKAYRLWMMAVYFPDQYVVWGWWATFKAVLLHLSNRYDIVYTTAHPQSGHLPGFVLKKLGVKWVADYRDAGILSYYYLLSKDYEKGRLRMFLESYYQKSVLHHADHVISHSKFLKSEFSKRFEVPLNKISDISNGYDESDFDDISSIPSRSSPHIHMLHMGIWYLSKEESIMVIDKLNELHLDLEGLGRSLVVHGLGFDIAGGLGGDSLIRFEYEYHRTVPHKQVFHHLLGADVYLMANTNTIDMTGFLPGKLWEYLRGGKPILFFGSGGEAWQIVEECACGIRLDYEKGQKIDPHELIGLCASSKCQLEKAERHSWRSRALEFQDLFNNCLASSQRTNEV